MDDTRVHILRAAEIIHGDCFAPSVARNDRIFLGDRFSVPIKNLNFPAMAIDTKGANP
jgi:hypothetical protein